jgi:hypothetical protein
LFSRTRNITKYDIIYIVLNFEAGSQDIAQVCLDLDISCLCHWNVRIKGMHHHGEHDSVIHLFLLTVNLGAE